MNRCLIKFSRYFRRLNPRKPKIFNPTEGFQWVNRITMKMSTFRDFGNISTIVPGKMQTKDLPETCIDIIERGDTIDLIACNCTERIHERLRCVTQHTIDYAASLIPILSLN